MEMIEDYLKKEEVVDTDEVISAYTLYNILLEKFKPLYDLNHNKDFEDEMYSLYTHSSLKRLLSVEKNGFNRICKIKTSFNSDVSSISFKFGSYIICEINKSKNTNEIYNTRVSKLNNKNYGYYYDTLDKKIINKCIDEIDFYFTIMDMYQDFFTDNTFIRQQFIGSNSDLVLGFNDSGEVFYTVHLLKNEDEDTYESDNTDILKYIPIKINSLNDEFKKIYLENINSKNNGLQKIYP